jgi:LysM repeat protein
MKKIPYALIMMVLFLSLVVSGCNLSSSKGIEEPPTVEAEIPFPVGDTTNRVTEMAAETQTAAGGDTNVVPTAEPVVNTPEPTQVPVVVVPSATPGVPATYILQEGEHPYCIARRFNVNPNDLVALNGISGSVAPGTTLKIPANSTWPDGASRALKTHPTTYTVVSGDSIYSVACKFGDVDPNSIVAANSLQSPYSLTGGTTLQIP